MAPHAFPRTARSWPTLLPPARVLTCGSTTWTSTYQRSSPSWIRRGGGFGAAVPGTRGQVEGIDLRRPVSSLVQRVARTVVPGTRRPDHGRPLHHAGRLIQCRTSARVVAGEDPENRRTAEFRSC